MSKIVFKIKNGALNNPQPPPSQPSSLQQLQSHPKKIMITVNKDAVPTNEITPETSIKPTIKLHVPQKITNTEIGSKPNTNNKPIVKLHVTKKINDNHSYEMLTVDQQLQPVPHDPVKLPHNLYLEPFFYQNYSCWINRSSGYIFMPNDIQNNKFEPIGQLIEEPPTIKYTILGQHLLPKRRIKWFYHYALDANNQ